MRLSYPYPLPGAPRLQVQSKIREARRGRHTGFTTPLMVMPQGVVSALRALRLMDALTGGYHRQRLCQPSGLVLY